MAAVLSKDLPVLLLWLCVAALLFMQLELPGTEKPNNNSQEAAVPQPSPEAEAPKPDRPAAPALRIVSLPPPPSPAAHSDAARTPSPAPKSVTPSTPPQNKIRALKPRSRPAAPSPRQPVVPLRPAPPQVTASKISPPEPAPRTIEALKPEEPNEARPDTADRPPPQDEGDLPPKQPEAQDPAPEAEPVSQDENVVTVDQVEVKDGRTLLRLLEHGSGPEIELAWPDSQAERRRLYQRLHDCFGMRIAVMDRSGRLYRDSSGTMASWRPNMDLYSGFMRSPSGRLAPEEEALLRALRRQVPSAGPVRLFPRRVDALLLGGLQALMGPRYGALQSIQGRYRVRGNRILIEGVQGDGRPVAGTLDLTPAIDGGCAHAES